MTKAGKIRIRSYISSDLANTAVKHLYAIGITAINLWSCEHRNKRWKTIIRDMETQARSSTGERGALNPEVDGSIPSAPATQGGIHD